MLDKIKDKIGYDPLRLAWASRIIPLRELRYLFDGRSDGSDELEYIRHKLDHTTAMEIFELIRDGKRYVVQAKWFSDLPDKEKVTPWRREYDSSDHDFHLGYHGSISEVEEVVPDRITKWPSMHEMVAIMPDYRSPTWKEIKKGIMARLKDDITVSNFFLWFYKEVVARILYRPEINPEHWGVGCFKGE